MAGGCRNGGGRTSLDMASQAAIWPWELPQGPALQLLQRPGSPGLGPRVLPEGRQLQKVTGPQGP